MNKEENQNRTTFLLPWHVSVFDTSLVPNSQTMVKMSTRPPILGEDIEISIDPETNQVRISALGEACVLLSKVHEASPLTVVGNAKPYQAFVDGVTNITSRKPQ